MPEQKKPKNIEKQVQPPIYTDEMVSLVSPYGFTLCFGQKGMNGPMLSVGMSPQHAKSMNQMLQKQIAEYEEKHGEIHLDSKVQQDFEEVVKNAAQKYGG